jgi:sodium/proline symporter
MNPAAVAILVTLVTYKVILIGIGIFAQRRTADGVDFFLGGRRLGPVVAAVSASASSSSAWTLLGVCGFAYSLGLSALWLFPACVGGFAFNWYVLAPALRRLTHRTKAVTTTDVLVGETPRAGQGAIRGLATAIILASLATYVASQFQAAGETFAETFELDATVSVLIGAAIVVFYTLLGGFWAVSLTDTLQGLMMAAAAIILPLAALFTVGPGTFVEALPRVPVDGYMSLVRNMGPVAGIGFALGLLGIGLGYTGQPHVVNRFMALRPGDKEMRTARRVAIGWAVIVYSGMILLGLCARVGFTVTNPEQALITVAIETLHPVIAGVMIAAVLSAVMSTADSQLLVAASSVTHDLRLGGPTARSMLIRSRVVVLALSVAAVIAAIGVEATIFDRVLFAWSSMGAAFGPLLLVTAIRGPVSARGTIVAMLAGFSLSVTAFYVKGEPWIPNQWAGVFERIVPFLVALGIALGCSSSRKSP